MDAWAFSTLTALQRPGNLERSLPRRYRQALAVMMLCQYATQVIQR
jgi:hypothetical protein